MKFRYLFLVVLPVVGFASGGDGPTDIVARTINFLIFAGILYYFINKPLRDFVVGRKKGIADKLDAIQQKLKASKDEKRKALEKVEEAKSSAQHIIATANKEAQILVKKIESDCQSELENLEKASLEQQEITRRKMTRSVVNEVVESIFAQGEVNIDNDALLDIVKKKVA